MRKLLILNVQTQYDASDLENYLYDTEASRDDFLDMLPSGIQSGKLSSTSWHYSEWALAHKDEGDYDYLHVVHQSDTRFAFDDKDTERVANLYKAFIGTQAMITVVYHKANRTIVIVKLAKVLSAIVTEGLKQILESVDREEYTEELAKTLGLGEEVIRAD